MTVKEIAKAVNKTERAVQKWVKKVREQYSPIDEKCSLASPANPVDFDLNETIIIIEQGLGKNAAAIYADNARANERKIAVSFDDVMASIKALADTVNLSLQSYNQRLENLESRFEQRKELLPAPKKGLREQLNQIVRNYAVENEMNYGVVWGKLYQEVYYRMNINIKIKSKNENKTILDYAEENGLLPEMLAIAIEIF